MFKRFHKKNKIIVEPEEITELYPEGRTKDYPRSDIYQRFLDMHEHTDLLLDNFIEILHSVEKKTLDKKLMRYIGKLKVYRNLITHNREQWPKNKYELTRMLISNYAKCFGKTKKIIRKTKKYYPETSNLLGELYQKMIDNNDKYVQKNIKVQLWLDSETDNFLHQHYKTT